MPGLANSFYIPYAQSLTDSDKTAACPQHKVATMDGPKKQLTGGYAAVTGYSYAVKPCMKRGSSCKDQDLKGLAAALEESPISVCINSENWDDYTTGVMSSAACGEMSRDYLDHCVMAVGFNATAPKPYWIVRNSCSVLQPLALMFFRSCAVLAVMCSATVNIDTFGGRAPLT